MQPYSLQTIKIPELKKLAKKPYYIYNITFAYINCETVAEGTEYATIRYNYNIYFGFDNRQKKLSFTQKEIISDSEFLNLVNKKAFEEIIRDYKLMNYTRSKK